MTAATAFIVTTGCTECQRGPGQLESIRNGNWECSHVACPHRRQVTAAPPDTDSFAFESSGCWRVRPDYSQD